MFNGRDHFSRALFQAGEEAAKAKKRSAVIGGVVAPVYQLIGMTLALSILGYAATRTLDVPALGAVAILLMRSVSYGQALQTSYHKLQESEPVTAELEKLNRQYLAARERSGASLLVRVESVQLYGVSFAYDGTGFALRNIDLTMRAGEHIGVVGPSGAGKSTLAQVLLRLRNPTSGSYCINGLPACDYTEESYHSCVAYLPQQSRVFAGTVRETSPLTSVDKVTLMKPSNTHTRRPPVHARDRCVRRQGIDTPIVPLG